MEHKVLFEEEHVIRTYYCVHGLSIKIYDEEIDNSIVLEKHPQLGWTYYVVAVGTYRARSDLKGNLFHQQFLRRHFEYFSFDQFDELRKSGIVMYMGASCEVGSQKITQASYGPMNQVQIERSRARLGALEKDLATAKKRNEFANVSHIVREIRTERDLLGDATQKVPEKKETVPNNYNLPETHAWRITQVDLRTVPIGPWNTSPKLESLEQELSAAKANNDTLLICRISRAIMDEKDKEDLLTRTVAMGILTEEEREEMSQPGTSVGSVQIHDSFGHLQAGVPSTKSDVDLAKGTVYMIIFPNGGDSSPVTILVCWQHEQTVIPVASCVMSARSPEEQNRLILGMFKLTRYVPRASTIVIVHSNMGLEAERIEDNCKEAGIVAHFFSENGQRPGVSWGSAKIRAGAALCKQVKLTSHSTIDFDWAINYTTKLFNGSDELYDALCLLVYCAYPRPKEEKGVCPTCKQLMPNDPTEQMNTGQHENRE